MGVAGSGKTTVGQELAASLGWNFGDADDFHPPANVAKMSAGIPLNDDDRAPWLKAIRAHIEALLSAGRSGVVTCSALKQRYRAVLTDGLPEVRLVHLTGDFDLILSRMNARRDHFMKPEMLRSQFEALEPPAHALTVDIARPPEIVAAEIREKLGLER